MVSFGFSGRRVWVFPGGWRWSTPWFCSKGSCGLCSEEVFEGAGVAMVPKFGALTGVALGSQNPLL